MNRLLITLTLLAVSLASLAGDRGHGGDVIICESQEETTYELLDYFEARTENGRVIELPGNNWKEKVNSFLKRLEVRDYRMATELRKLFFDFLKSSVFIDRSLIPQIDDSFSYTQLKKNCKKRQAAVQKVNIKPMEKRYLIDKKIWVSLDDLEKSGLVIHELIYRLETISAKSYQKEIRTSDELRYFHGIIASDEFQLISPLAYIDLVQQTLFFSSSSFLQDGYEIELPGRFTRYHNMIKKHLKFNDSTGKFERGFLVYENYLKKFPWTRVCKGKMDRNCSVVNTNWFYASFSSDLGKFLELTSPKNYPGQSINGGPLEIIDQEGKEVSCGKNFIERQYVVRTNEDGEFISCYDL